MAPETNTSLSTRRQDIINDISRLSEEKSAVEENISNLNSHQKELLEIVSNLETKKTELTTAVVELEERISGHTETLDKLKLDIDSAQKAIGIPNENGIFPVNSLNWKKIKIEEDIKLQEKLAKTRKAQIDKEVNIIENVCI